MVRHARQGLDEHLAVDLSGNIPCGLSAGRGVDREDETLSPPFDTHTISIDDDDEARSFGESREATITH
ncbi:MAG TPA: hypothetical protein VHK45_05590 [Geminicoccaceae bacterium]|nr:hypothetical protein [Geminicoccaceae bacterium]